MEKAERRDITSTQTSHIPHAGRPRRAHGGRVVQAGPRRHGTVEFGIRRRHGDRWCALLPRQPAKNAWESPREIGTTNEPLALIPRCEKSDICNVFPVSETDHYEVQAKVVVQST